MIDDRISSLELKANLRRYIKSLKRFRISVEQMFSLLHIRNKKLEDVLEDDDEDESGKATYEERKQGGIEYIAKLPNELKILVL